MDYILLAWDLPRLLCVRWKPSSVKAPLDQATRWINKRVSVRSNIFKKYLQKLQRIWTGAKPLTRTTRSGKTWWKWLKKQVKLTILTQKWTQAAIKVQQLQLTHGKGQHREDLHHMYEAKVVSTKPWTVLSIRRSEALRTLSTSWRVAQCSQFFNLMLSTNVVKWRLKPFSLSPAALKKSDLVQGSQTDTKQKILQVLLSHQQTSEKHLNRVKPAYGRMRMILASMMTNNWTSRRWAKLEAESAISNHQSRRFPVLKLALTVWKPDKKVKGLWVRVATLNAKKAQLSIKFLRHILIRFLVNTAQHKTHKMNSRKQSRCVVNANTTIRHSSLRIRPSTEVIWWMLTKVAAQKFPKNSQATAKMWTKTNGIARLPTSAKKLVTVSSTKLTLSYSDS